MADIGQPATRPRGRIGLLAGCRGRGAALRACRRSPCARRFLSEIRLLHQPAVLRDVISLACGPPPRSPLDQFQSWSENSSGDPSSADLGPAPVAAFRRRRSSACCCCAWSWPLSRRNQRPHFCLVVHRSLMEVGGHRMALAEIGFRLGLDSPSWMTSPVGEAEKIFCSGSSGRG